MRVVALVAVSSCAAALILPTHIASSMVIQRDAPFTMWGIDTPAARVSINYFGMPLAPVTADASGRFSVVLPATPANVTPGVIALSSSASAGVTLSDVLVGDVYVCSGQSNMGLPVSWAIEYKTILAAAGALGPTLRLLQVALLDEYTNSTTPQVRFSLMLDQRNLASA